MSTQGTSCIECQYNAESKMLLTEKLSMKFFGYSTKSLYPVCVILVIIQCMVVQSIYTSVHMGMRAVVTSPVWAHPQGKARLCGLYFILCFHVVWLYTLYIMFVTLVFQKINMKNAFSLQLIDYMAMILKKEDSKMENFQVKYLCHLAILEQLLFDYVKYQASTLVQTRSSDLVSSAYRQLFTDFWNSLSVPSLWIQQPKKNAGFVIILCFTYIVFHHL